MLSAELTKFGSFSKSNCKLEVVTIPVWCSFVSDMPPNDFAALQRELRTIDDLIGISSPMLP